MNLSDWHKKAQVLNAKAPRRCPRQVPCSLNEDIAIYEYVTGKEGRAIVLRCQNCGALEHLEMSLGDGGIFQPVWSTGQELPPPHRVVHLPGDPGARVRKRAQNRRMSKGSRRP